MWTGCGVVGWSRVEGCAERSGWARGWCEGDSGGQRGLKGYETFEVGWHLGEGLVGQMRRSGTRFCGVECGVGNAWRSLCSGPAAAVGGGRVVGGLDGRSRCRSRSRRERGWWLWGA